jgi:hypothetical protein
MAAATAVTALALAGCTAALDVSGTDWAKPTATSQQVTLDETECARVTSDAGQTPDLIIGGVADAVRFAIRESTRRHVYDQCMVSRGYERRAG